MELGGQHESVLARLYRALFVPYVIFWLLYTIFAVVITGFLAFLGLSQVLAFYAFLAVVSLALLAWTSRRLARMLLARNARAHSPNPFVRRISESETIRFLENSYVEYSVQLVVRAVVENINSMDFLISWHGDPKDITIYDSHGCSVGLHDQVDHAGKVLRLLFQKSLPTKSNYPIGFSVLIDNKSGSIKPYLRKIGPYMAEDRITTTVILKEKSKKIFVERVQYSSGDKRPVKEKYIEVPSDSHTATVNHPVQGFSYFVGIVEL